MSDLDLDELARRTRRVRRSRRRRADARRARSASSPASRKSSVSSRSTAAPRSTAKTATSSSGSMPCASTACARLRNAVRCSRRSTIKGLLAGAATPPPRPSRRWTTTSCWPSWKARPARPTSPSCAMSAPAPRSAPPRKSPTARRARTSRRSSRCSSRCRATRMPASARRGRSQTDQGRDSSRASSSSSAARSPMSPRWARSSRPQYDRRDSRLRVIYDNGTESNVLLRSLQRALHTDEAGRRITDPVAGPLFSDESDGRTTWRAARSTCCAASPTIRSSRPTATCCTRSA